MGNQMNLLTVSFETVGGAGNEADLNLVMDINRLDPFDWDEFAEKD